MYARMLRLRHLSPSGFLCFVYLEGAVALGILLALAELVSWWGIIALPLTVAVMVKLNDVIAGSLTRAESPIGAVAAARSGAAAPGGQVGRRTGPGGRGPDPLSGAPTIRPASAGVSSGAGPRRPVEFSMDERALARARTVDLRNPGGQAMPVISAAEAAAVLNEPPQARNWADELDTREQWTRQSAARRYE